MGRISGESTPSCSLAEKLDLCDGFAAVQVVLATLPELGVRRTRAGEER